MSQNKWKNSRNLKIDSRTAQDLRSEMANLAACYAPEWQFGTQNPDIGSTIGILFSEQMAEGIDRLNQVIEEYHTEFVNMLGISLLPGKPACAVVLMDLAQDTIPGVEVRRGTRLFAADADDGIIYETSAGMYITGSRLVDAFMTIGDEGRIIPLVDKEAEIPEDEAGHLAILPFTLFDREREGIEKNALLFYHETIFDAKDNSVFVRVEGGSGLIEKIKSGAYGFYYFAEDDEDTEEGKAKERIPVEHTRVLDDGMTVELRCERPNEQLETPDGYLSQLALIANEPVLSSLPVKSITFSSSGNPSALAFASDGNTDYNTESFDPFGDTLSLYAECYLGHEYFKKKGARITIDYRVSYFEHYVSLTPQQEDEELKIIKRRPRGVQTDNPASAFVDTISIEYFNGIGWKKLVCLQEYECMFADEKLGSFQLSFICPGDWEDVSVGAYEGRCLRIQILKSDNCYMRPGVHHYPHLDGMRVAYTYEDSYLAPQRLTALVGTDVIDLTRHVQQGRPYTAFSRCRYEDDALFIAINRRIEGGPVSLLFQMEDGIPYEGTGCAFFYSTQNGFKQMKVMDHTMGMSRSGVVMFMPQADMAPVTLEGTNAFWIKISPESKEESDKVIKPNILGIHLNAVEVSNIDTRPEQEFYLEEIAPNLQFDLGVSDILDVDVWVNEMGRHPLQRMQEMIAKAPEDIQYQTNSMGEISAFFVKWTETDQLNRPGSGREYVLDRLSSTLMFGDGIHMEIPRVIDDVAFKVVVRVCRGLAGNVPPGRINEPMGSLMYISRITNPMKAFGGSNMENVDSALERGANILSGRRRLVSQLDYERAILARSDNIDKVKCVCGTLITGERDEGSLTFAVLLSDYRSGSYSFHSEAGNLRKYLLEECEMTIRPEDLHIVEPIFVTVNVNIWAQVDDPEKTFGIQGLLQTTMDRYLEPVSSEDSNGWQIGALPKKNQIIMRLSVLKDMAVIRKLTITASYSDETGFHERELEDIQPTPFMVVRSGTHRIHILEL